MASDVDSEVVKAKLFWAGANVDNIFDEVCIYLVHLRGAFKDCTATDTEYVKGMKLISLLASDLRVPVTPPESLVQVIFCSEGPPLELPETSSSQTQPVEQNGPTSPISLQSFSLSESQLPPAVSEELAPLVLNQFHYKPHKCSKACLPCLPDFHQSIALFWGQNPLRIPLLCGFQRLSALTSEAGGGALEWEREDTVDSEDEDTSPEAPRQDVVYKAPCGFSLCSYANVTSFLLATESYDVLQVDFFSFNPVVCLDSPCPAGPRLPEQDLSRGTEPTPVELCPGEGGSRPEDFRYRRDRWPHGCFLSRSSLLFDACCDCTDGCVDAGSCACVGLTRGGHHYTSQRLTEPVPPGLYECGPWCGCDRARCQNRLVQRGVRVRLQVFQTADRGWGVRCRDDVDQGTFICMYAGLVLRRGQGPQEAHPPVKRLQAEQLSDDEVEVVTEWLAPPVKESRGSLLEPPAPASLPLHVPVIQRPADTSQSPQTRPEQGDELVTIVVGNLVPECSPSDGSEDQSEGQESVVARTRENSEPIIRQVILERAEPKQSLKRSREEDTYYLDASAEGNVARFFNHSCQPNLFAQSVFTDSHDPGFPVVAFFTSRMIKAGTELTWKYSSEPGSSLGENVAFHCGSEDCLGHLSSQQNHCDVCEVDGQNDTAKHSSVPSEIRLRTMLQ